MSAESRVEYLIVILKDHAQNQPTYTARMEALDSINKMIENQSSEKDYLHALCDGMFYGNWPWIKYPYQAESRIHRIGQKFKTINIITEITNIDEHINQTLASKKKEGDK